MTWLARLSFAQAVRWALVWPALLVGAAVAGVSLVVAGWQGDWAFAFNISEAGAVPVWLAVTLALLAVLFGPSLAFLALWRVARR
jgi:hypothetical protein